MEERDSIALSKNLSMQQEIDNLKRQLKVAKQNANNSNVQPTSTAAPAADSNLKELQIQLATMETVLVSLRAGLKSKQDELDTKDLELKDAVAALDTANQDYADKLNSQDAANAKNLAIMEEKMAEMEEKMAMTMEMAQTEVDKLLASKQDEIDLLLDDRDQTIESLRTEVAMYNDNPETQMPTTSQDVIRVKNNEIAIKEQIISKLQTSLSQLEEQSSVSGNRGSSSTETHILYHILCRFVFVTFCISLFCVFCR